MIGFLFFKEKFMKTRIAIYFDLENIDSEFNLDKMLDAVLLKIEDSEAVFASKLACGNENAISNFRVQLRDLNFEIREAPKVSGKNLKNRADLILSLEAFETIVQKIPEINIYVFITSDTDFTVVMDKLRKYGKEVWLVVRKSDKDKKLFVNSADKILVIDDYFASKKDTSSELLKLISDLKFSDFESGKIKEVIESFEKDKWIASSSFGAKIHNMIKDFTYKGKTISSQNKLFEKLKDYIETKKDGNVDYFKVIK